MNNIAIGSRFVTGALRLYLLGDHNALLDANYDL